MSYGQTNPLASDPSFNASSATLDATTPLTDHPHTHIPKHAGDTNWPFPRCSTDGSNDHVDFPPTTITLRPIATPAALGLASYASAAFVVGAYLAGWYGDDASVGRIWPFVLFVGGVAGVAAGMWSFVARDSVASVAHTVWGCFWFAVALTWATTTTTLNDTDGRSNGSPYNRWGLFDNFAIWLVPVAAISYSCSLALMRREMLVASVYGLAGVAATLNVVGWFIPSKSILHIGSYFWLFSSLISVYRVWVYFMHEAARDDRFLPSFRTRWGTDVSNGKWTEPMGEPGVRKE